ASLTSKIDDRELSNISAINRNLVNQSRLRDKLQMISSKMAQKGADTAALAAEGQRVKQQLRAAMTDERRLRLIAQQNQALRVQLGEEQAIEAQLRTIGIAEARRLDQLEAQFARLQKMQLSGRAISHAGRAGLFAGLVGTAA